jgi:hypothetical protein
MQSADAKREYILAAPCSEPGVEPSRRSREGKVSVAKSVGLGNRIELAGYQYVSVCGLRDTERTCPWSFTGITDFGRNGIDFARQRFSNTASYCRAYLVVGNHARSPGNLEEASARLTGIGHSQHVSPRHRHDVPGLAHPSLMVRLPQIRSDHESRSLAREHLPRRSSLSSELLAGAVAT